MRFSKLILAAALAAVPATSLQAQYFTNATPPNRDETPFWDVDSDDDGRGCNIGYVLTGTQTACNNQKLLAGYDPYSASFQDKIDNSQAWFAHADGNQDATVGFYFFAGAGSTVTYFGGIAGANPLRDLFIRDLSTNTIVHTFKENDVSTHSFLLTSNMNFDIGIALMSGGTAYSWNPGGQSQFASFGSGTTYAYGANCGASGCWVGSEDRTLPSDYDYNDGILRIAGASIVPEPSAVLLVASGLMGLAGVAVRRRNQA